MTLWWPIQVFSILDWAEWNGGVWSGMEEQEDLSSFEVMLLNGIKYMHGKRILRQNTVANQQQNNNNNHFSTDVQK